VVYFIHRPGNLIPMACPAQNNSSDCGIYTILFSLRVSTFLLEQNFSNIRESFVEEIIEVIKDIDDNQAAQYRLRMIDEISKLSEK
jgi:Ulp1 family protease